MMERLSDTNNKISLMKMCHITQISLMKMYHITQISLMKMC